MMLPSKVFLFLLSIVPAASFLAAHSPKKQRVSIVNCKDKPNIPYFATVVKSKKKSINKRKEDNKSIEVITASDDYKNVSDEEKRSGLLWRGVVVGLCALGASNFVVAKLVMNVPGIDSSLYALSRFGIAALALLPGSIAAVKRGAIDWNTAKTAALCGFWVAFGYMGQTLGLMTTTANRSCVISTLRCVFVAIVAETARVSKLSPSNEKESGTSSTFDLKRLVSPLVAVAGVGIIELFGATDCDNCWIGDALSFAQPIGFGTGYILLEKLMRNQPGAALPVSAIKIAMTAISSFAFFQLSPLINGVANFSLRIPDFTPIISSPLAIGGILYTGLITTAFGLWMESLAFKRVPATDASIILTAEPIFAALAGASLLGETFVGADYLGAALIFGACVYTILLDNKPQKYEAIDTV